MDNPKRDANKGQQMPHTVAQVDESGQVIPGTQTTMTQAEWRNRDKSSNLVRVDEAGEVVPDDGGDAGDETDGGGDTGGGTPDPTA